MDTSQEGGPSGAELTGRRSPITLRRNSSSDEDLRTFNNSKMFEILRRNGSEEKIIEKLAACLEAGADINARNNRGRTVLYVAKNKNYNAVVEFLLRYGIVSGIVSDKIAPAAQQVDIDEGFITPTVTEYTVDENLQLSSPLYIKPLILVTKGSINNKLNLDPYPSNRTLAMLAANVYSDNSDDETPQNLPEDWKLLTTAKNSTNGYFGAAFLQPVLQQVVVAHRGTEVSSRGAVWTDVKSIIWNKLTSHVCSAITFTEAIAAALHEAKGEGVSLQLSITGHSLGGWLGQVTALAVQYLQRDGTIFRMMDESKEGFHAHTVVFESPGCRPMLSKMKEIFDQPYKRSIFLRRLDINSYLSVPNSINCLNLHVGEIFRVKTDLSDVGALDKHTSSYTSKTNSMEKMWRALGTPDVAEILVWPFRSVLRGEKYTDFFINANLNNKYHQPTKHYKYQKIDKKSSTLRIFSEQELLMLDLWKILKGYKLILPNLTEGRTVDDLFDEFEIDRKKQIIECASEESLRKIIRHTKALMRWVPAEVMTATRESTALVPSAAGALFRTEAGKFFHSLKRSQVDFRDTTELEAFLTSGKKVLVIRSPDSDMEMVRIANIFHQIKKSWKYLNTCDIESDNYYSFMDIKEIKRLESMVSISGLYQSCFADGHLFFIKCTENDVIYDTIFKEISTNLNNNANNKLVLVNSYDTDFEDLLKNSNKFELKHSNEIKLSDLTEMALNVLLDKKNILLQGDQLSLRDFVGECCHLNRLSELIGPQILKYMLYSNIEVKEVLLQHDDLLVHSTVNKEVSEARVNRFLKQSPDALLVISGIGREELKKRVQSLREGSEGKIITTAGDGESIFKKISREKPNSNVYWFVASAEHVSCKGIHEKGFYIERRFHRVIFEFKKFVQPIDTRTIFVLQNVKDISEKNKNIYLTSDHIKTVTSDEEVDDIIKNNPDMPIHVLEQEANGGPIFWQRSRGTLEGVRPYIAAERGDLIHEEDLSKKASNKVVIIADDPGMGKSTTLTSVSRLLRRSAWVIRIDLRDFQIAIQKLPIELTLKSVCELLLGDRGGCLRGLLQFCMDKEHEHSRGIYIFFDGFDEIERDSYSRAEGEVLRLSEYLINETRARVWVTTRLYKKEILENYLSTFATRFERIGEIQQRDFLANFWRSLLLLEMENYGDAEKEKLDKCAECVYKNAKKILGDDVPNFMLITLQMRMLADVCLMRVKDYLESTIDIESIFDIKNVLDLYQRFVNLRYEIYFSENMGLNERMDGNIKNNNIEQITEKHRMLGLRTLFPKFVKDNFDDPEAGWGAELCRVGLVQAGGGGTGDAEFTHRTLAEFYSADLVVKWLRKRGQYYGHAPIVNLMLSEILLRDSHSATRIFMNYLVLSESLCNDVKEFIALKMNELWREKQHSLFNRDMETALHVAVREGNTGIIDILVGGFQCAPEQLIGFLAAHDQDRFTALGRAARAGRRDITEKMIQSIGNCSYKVRLELLLATYVPYSSVPEEFLNNCLQETANYSEIKMAFDRTAEIIQEHIPPFLAAVRAGRAKEVGELCRKVENDTEMLYMLLAPDGEVGCGGTVLHRLAQDPRNEDRDTIIKHITTALCNQHVSALGRSYDTFGQTPLHWAAAAGHLNLVEYLISHGVYIDSFSRLSGETALFWAARAGSLPVARYLIEKGADINILNNNCENVLFEAVRADSLPLVQHLTAMGLNKIFRNKIGENILEYAGDPKIKDFIKKWLL